MLRIEGLSERKHSSQHCSFGILTLYKGMSVGTAIVVRKHLFCMASFRSTPHQCNPGAVSGCAPFARYSNHAWRRVQYLKALVFFQGHGSARRCADVTPVASAFFLWSMLTFRVLLWLSC